MRFLIHCLLICVFATGAAFAQTAPRVDPAAKSEPVLGIGDAVKISVYQIPDLATEARVSELGQINFPLLGPVTIGGLTVSAAQGRIEKLLRDGGFVLKPQVTIQTVLIRSSQISILGQVGKPGRYPIEIVGSKVSEMIALAGGVVPGGSDLVTLVGTRDGKAVRLEIDLPTILQSGRADLDVAVENGDIVYVDRAPSFYIYGEVQRPGQFRLERGMSLMQALAQSGGISARGTERGMKVHRKDPSGAVKILDIKLNDPVERDDVIYIRESLF